MQGTYCVQQLGSCMTKAMLSAWLTVVSAVVLVKFEPTLDLRKRKASPSTVAVKKLRPAVPTAYRETHTTSTSQFCGYF